MAGLFSGRHSILETGSPGCFVVPFPPRKPGTRTGHRTPRIPTGSRHRGATTIGRLNRVASQTSARSAHKRFARMACRDCEGESYDSATQRRSRPVLCGQREIDVAVAVIIAGAMTFCALACFDLVRLPPGARFKIALALL